MDLETQTQITLQNPAPPIPPEQGSELTAFNIIRTETVLSKLPVHNLAKKGRVNIEIVKQAPDGQLELKWIVSYSDRYGQARQLAYKLDTIVVDRVIEDAGKPLPERICLGSLRDICKEMDIPEGGQNLKTLKRAFLQNASLFITAKFKYKGNDGIERTLEAGFTRYSVIFTGEKFPDGTKADAVYILLNNPYREVLNNAPMRPLDLDYKKILPPAAQRFYEIVSYKIFTALKYNQPAARLAYSEYCTFSAQQRYFTRAQVQKQMYKLHLPHKNSGYIESMEYEETTDQQGNPDWLMLYVPGPKARNDHALATGKKLPRMIDGATPQSKAGDRGARSHRPRQRRLNLKPVIQEPPQPSQAAIIIDYRLVAELAKRGISETDARTILATLPPAQAVLDQLEYGDLQINLSRGKITNPAGFYISLLQRNVTPPATFETSQARKARQEAELARAEATQKAQQDAEAREEAERGKLDELFAALPSQEQADLERQVKAELKARHPNVNWDDGTAVHEGTIRAGIRRLLQSRPVPPVSQSAPTVAEQQGTGETVAPVEQQAAAPLTPLQLLTILTMLQLPGPKPAPATPEILQN